MEAVGLSGAGLQLKELSQAADLTSDQLHDPGQDFELEFPIQNGIVKASLPAST